MKKIFILLLMSVMFIICNCSQNRSSNLVFIKGGNFKNTKSSFYGKNVTIPDFYIGKYEVTQKEWIDVMGSNPSNFKGDNLPVEMVSWYEIVEYCNKRSIKEDLEPYYNIDKNKKDPNNTNDYDNIKWTVTINTDANGYRLPTVAEWEYAAMGGQKSKSYTYSGSNNADEVAWYWKNSGDKKLAEPWNYNIIVKNNNRTKPVGSKKYNELRLYDMSGNVREWCLDRYKGDEFLLQGRVWKGGGWLGGEEACEPSFWYSWEANARGPDQGFRVCRTK